MNVWLSCLQERSGGRLGDPSWWQSLLMGPLYREMTVDALQPEEVALMNRLFGGAWDPTTQVRPIC